MVPSIWLWNPTFWVQIPTLPLGTVWWLSLPEPQSPWLSNGENSRAYFLGCRENQMGQCLKCLVGLACRRISLNWSTVIVIIVASFIDTQLFRGQHAMGGCPQTSFSFLPWDSLKRLGEGRWWCARVAHCLSSHILALHHKHLTCRLCQASCVWGTHRPQEAGLLRRAGEAAPPAYECGLWQHCSGPILPLSDWASWDVWFLICKVGVMV